MKGSDSKINSIVGRLRINAKSLIYDLDSNRVEQFHSLVAKTVGGKRINYSRGQSYTNRNRFAIRQHNTKRRAHYELSKHILGKSPSCRIQGIEQSRLNKNNKRKLREQNNLKKGKINFLAPDENYGDNCNKPDLDSENLQKETSKLSEFLKAQCEDRVNIEILTKGQADNTKWHEIRRNRLTASYFGVVCRIPNPLTCCNRVNGILYKNLMEYGSMNEKVAIVQLEQQISIKVLPCGIFTDKDDAGLAASPDGLILDQNGIIEIKCPFSAKGMSPDYVIRERKIRFWSTY